MYVSKIYFVSASLNYVKLSSGRQVPVCKVAQLLNPILPAKFTETTFMQACFYDQFLLWKTDYVRSYWYDFKWEGG